MANDTDKIKKRIDERQEFIKNNLIKPQKPHSQPTFEIIIEDETIDKSSHLAPLKHKQEDFFIADLGDSLAFRDDLPSMEHPLFALRAGDTNDRLYESANKDVTVSITPTSAGRATIHDKDIWIYCISRLMQAVNANEPLSEKIRFTTYNFLVSTNRGTGGREYALLENSLKRLAGTRITTNIKTGDIVEQEGFGLIQGWKTIKHDVTGKMLSIEVTLPTWLFRSIAGKQVLSISPHYFRLRKPLDRRIYEIARKHCGNKEEWVVSLDVLLNKTTATSTLNKFRHSIKSLALTDALPDYSVSFNEENDMVIFKKRY